jgi:hypothetical protein
MHITSECYHVIITTNISLNIMARWLENNMGIYAGGRSVTAWVRCKESCSTELLYLAFVYSNKQQISHWPFSKNKSHTLSWGFYNLLRLCVTTCIRYCRMYLYTTITIFLTFFTSSFVDVVLLIWLLPNTSAKSEGFNSGLDVLLLFFCVTPPTQLTAIKVFQVLV